MIPGWNEYVKEYRDRSMFWHSIWKSCDSPRHGIIADIRRQTRARYHSALRKVKTSTDNISANRLAEGLLADIKRDFWNEVKRIKKAPFIYRLLWISATALRTYQHYLKTNTENFIRVYRTIPPRWMTLKTRSRHLLRNIVLMTVSELTHIQCLSKMSPNM